MLTPKQTQHFKQLIEERISELERTASASQKETEAYATRHGDPADQATAEYERQAIVYRAAEARQKIKTLQQALERIRSGKYGECAECGGEIEKKRLEVVPWARYCITCQEARE